jgi:hypothetical protein
MKKRIIILMTVAAIALIVVVAVVLRQIDGRDGEKENINFIETVRVEEVNIPSVDSLQQWGVGILKEIPVIDDNKDFLSLAVFTDSSENFRVRTADLGYDLNIIDVSRHTLTYKPSFDIRAWSKDKKQLIFTINSGDPEMGMPVQRSESESSFLTTLLGDYLVDFQKGKIKKLDIPDNLQTKMIPIHDTLFLVIRDNVSEEGHTSAIETLGILNTNNLTINYIHNLQGNYGQYSIDELGDKWSFQMGPFDYAYSAIIYAEFPFLEGEIIEKGNWVEFQWPLISPDGSKVIFLKASNPSGNAFSLWLYDHNNGSKRKIVEEALWPEAWVDNESFIFQRFGESQGVSYLIDRYLYSLQDDSVVLIRP